MGRLIVWNLMTLDGCFEGPQRWSLDFHQLVWGDELERFSLEQAATAEALLFGRVTYEGMAAYWTTATGEIADFMNRVPKVVFSRTLRRADWNNSRVVAKDAEAEVGHLKAGTERDLFVFGSADLCSTLLGAGLVDEYRIGLVPVVLGRGTPLWKSPQRIPMALLEARPLESGCVILRYRPERAEQATGG